MESNNQGFKCDIEDCEYVATKNKLKKHRLIKHENPDANFATKTWPPSDL